MFKNHVLYRDRALWVRLAFWGAPVTWPLGTVEVLWTPEGTTDCQGTVSPSLPTCMALRDWVVSVL